ncbi:hypothetical protein DMR_37070 [Solidesulfovibrio magneticus RS-1]|uniref:Uncharacterized protein n=1 Tax=Solidesulfovibrio magneticus (strain ATCC 700980 / DSM 13731 / RS-1) TaxID=573370 RepID=C4XM70_SOLM1|nr:hypothetical protein DMR_37070 [Solidesulfovibrio magneticus RS-1]
MQSVTGSMRRILRIRFSWIVEPKPNGLPSSRNQNHLGGDAKHHLPGLDIRDLYQIGCHEEQQMACPLLLAPGKKPGPPLVLPGANAMRRLPP